MARPFSGTLGDGEIALLREFLVIVDAGGLSAAEARLNKGRSAISLNLKKLETRLGMTLCHRGRGGFRLTEEGRVAHSAAIQLLGEIDRFGAHIADASASLSGFVRFYADDSFVFVFQRQISDAIAELTANHPRLRLDIRVSDPEQVMAGVLDGAADLGLTAAPRRSDQLSYTPVFTERMGLFCGRRHPLFPRRKTLALKEVAGYQAISTIMEQTLDTHELMNSLSFTATAPTILSRVQLLLSGSYVGFLPLEVAAPWVARDELREIRVPGSRFDYPCHMITQRDGPEKPAVRLLQAALLKGAEAPFRQD